MKTIFNFFLSILMISVISMISCSTENTNSKHDNLNPTQSFDLSYSTLDISQYISEPPIDVPNNVTFYENVPYGYNEKQVIDIFIPNNYTYKKRSPILIGVHGGGFIVGDKSALYSGDNDIYDYLENGVAFININYRLVLNDDPDGMGVKKSFDDSRYVMRFISAYKNTLRLNDNNIVIKGGSAGAGIAQYLASKRKFSRKIKAISLNVPQSTYDMLKYNDIFSIYNFDLYQYTQQGGFEQRLLDFYGISDLSQIENDFNTVMIRRDISLFRGMSRYKGRIRMIAGNIGIPFGVPQTLNELTHHQLHAIEIYDRANQNGIYIDASIPHLGVELNDSEFDFIMESFN